MADSDKDILITPNVGESLDLPKIEFTGFDDSPITLRVRDNNSLSFDGSLGQIFSLNSNITTGITFSANDVSGIPLISTGSNGVAQLGAYGTNTAVGGTDAIAPLHVHQNTTSPNSPTLAFPDNTNFRYSAGFSSINVSGIGQRLDVYAGDSGSNTSNLGSNAVVMSVRSDKRVGIKTTAPNSPLDIVTLDSGTGANQAELGPELRSSGGEYRWRFVTNTDSNRWYFKWRVPSNESGGTNEALWMRSRTDKIGPEQWRFRAYGRNYAEDTETLRDLLYIDSYRVGVNRNGSFNGYASFEVNGATYLNQPIGLMQWGPTPSHALRMQHQIEFNQSGWSDMYTRSYYNNRQGHSWRTNYVTRNEAYYRSWPQYFEDTSGSTEGGRRIKTYNIVSLTSGQGVDTGDSKIVVDNVIHQYGPIGTSWEDDGYRVTNIAIPNYSRTATEVLDVDGNGTGVFAYNNPTLTVTITVEATTANSITGAAEGHKFHYNQPLSFFNTGVGTTTGGVSGDITQDSGNVSGTMNRNVSVYRTNSSDTNPYSTTFTVRIRNAGWEQFFPNGNAVPTAAGTYSFTNGATYNHTPPATARVKGRAVFAGLFNTGTGANIALDTGWNDRFQIIWLPPQGTALNYSTTVPANGSSAGGRGKEAYINTTRTASYNITNTGQLGTYGQYGMSWQNRPGEMYVGNGNQGSAFLDSIYSSINYCYSRIGYTDKRNYANAYIGYGEGVRGLMYNLFGGRFNAPRGVRSFVRNYRNGRMDSPFAFEGDFYNGLNANTSGAGYVGDARGTYVYMDTRYGSRTNSKFGIYTYTRCGIRADDRLDGTTVNNMYGAYHYMRFDGGSCSNARGVYVNYFVRGGNTSDGTTIAVNLPNRWGIYCNNEDKNYFSGRIGIGNTNPPTDERLRVEGKTVINGELYMNHGEGISFKNGGTRDGHNDSRLINLRDGNPQTDGCLMFTCDVSTVNDAARDIMKIFNNGVKVFNSLQVLGSVSKGSGSFKIDHPVPELAEKKHLVHSFVEGPRADLIYRDKVNLVKGTATVVLDEVVGMTPGTWEALCRDPQVFVTNNSGWTPVKGFMNGGTLTIVSQDPSCDDVVDWMVIAERQDPTIKAAEWTDDLGRPILEPDK